jgi:hypothetical protein
VKVLSLLLIASLCGFASAASAKQRRSYEIERRVMYDYAKCVVKRKRERASTALLANVTNSQILKEYKDLVIGDCLLVATESGGTMQFGGDLYRYALADALVNAELGSSNFTTFDDRAKLAHHTPPTKQDLEQALSSVKSKRKQAEIQSDFDKSVSGAWLSRFGECIVRGDPPKSKAWLLTKPTSDEETIQINMLKPVFNSCLAGEGNAKFNRITMRGLVALNFYRLARAPVVQAAGAQN